ncbi:MAG TPA: family 16 glycosylhydrolase [Oligoflexus sp.]|uniref:family 16 glycosylhydrolase n=1 Tax=Oligoflexus sp. TaxID=1971216 RepID=UPI002D3291ED|nr:family 16 glycosylhydrolase [Oligoflexus sp.]HYX38143.1 family 16 glycosylhydrolase [Oligoflexus sp.]
MKKPRRIPFHQVTGLIILGLAGSSCADRNTSPLHTEDTESRIVAAGSTSPITLRTRILNRFLTAENEGGGQVTANRMAAQAWETFTLLDKNGGSLESGDLVHLQTSGGFFVQAPPGDTTFDINAESRNQQDWETFRMVKAAGSGTIRDGDSIGLQAVTSGQWLSAENGGGGNVFSFGAELGPWEHWIIGSNPASPHRNGWTLIWSDEFNGHTIDESKWSYEVQKPGWVNHELQNYTGHRSENARVEQGNLVIEGRRDYFQGLEYSSARLKTQGKASWTYGRVEARIKLPSGKGTWPAFWMMPDNKSRGWPACGEIDIMEHVGYENNRIHATTHSQNYNWKRPEQRTGTMFTNQATEKFHLYAMEWYPDRIDFYVDSVKYYTSPNDYKGDDSWPFQKNFHIILNLAIGGDWGGTQGVDANVWPQKMLVDYVRVYQK